jgi:hypothetical protein
LKGRDRLLSLFLVIDDYMGRAYCMQWRKRYTYKVLGRKPHTKPVEELSVSGGYCIKMDHTKIGCELERTEDPAAGCCDNGGELLMMQLTLLQIGDSGLPQARSSPAFVIWVK